jgi:hypothetical protein
MQPQPIVPLTPDEHRELAGELRAADSRLGELCRLVTGIYGSESRAGDAFVKTCEAIRRLRHEMEVQATLDRPDSNQHVYL